MQEIVRDPLWQFVGAVLGILAIIVSIILFFAQRKKKSLEYKIISQTPVLSAAEEIAGQLQILFRGEPVQGVYLFVIRLLNAGNVPIASSDYERPVRLDFGEEARVLTAEVSDVEPRNLDAEIASQDSFVQLKPVLLNSGDVITIKALVSNYKGQLTIDGRIIGVKDIVPQKDTSNIWSIAFMLTGTVLLGVTLYLERQNIIPGRELPFKNPIANVTFVIGYILMLVGLLTTRPYRKRFERIAKTFAERWLG